MSEVSGEGICTQEGDPLPCCSADSYFFIEGKVYVDMDSEEAVRYYTSHERSLKGYPVRPVAWLNSLRKGGNLAVLSRRFLGHESTQQPSPTDIEERNEGVEESSTSSSNRDMNAWRALQARYCSPSDIPFPSSASSFETSPAAPSPDPEIEIMPMTSVQLKNLRFRAGVRYAYAHMNQRCEHFMYISDVRVFHPVVDTAHTYPRLMYMAKFDRRKCEICFLWSAQYITYGDRLALNNPTHFCQHCYHMLHYRTDGSLLYDDFNVFPYLHHMR